MSPPDKLYISRNSIPKATFFDKMIIWHLLIWTRWYLVFKAVLHH